MGDENFHGKQLDLCGSPFSKVHAFTLRKNSNKKNSNRLHLTGLKTAGGKAPTTALYLPSFSLLILSTVKSIHITTCNAVDAILCNLAETKSLWGMHKQDRTKQLATSQSSAFFFAAVLPITLQVFPYLAYYIFAIIM